MSFDECIPYPADREYAEQSMLRTLRWAERGKNANTRPDEQAIFGIVQGGSDPGLRMECGRRLEEIGFDGYGFGGWPLDAEGRFRLDILKMAADAMPDSKVKYAMGLGRPEEIAALVDMGYDLFDCVIPTREARHQRLYTWVPGMDTPEGVRRKDGKFYQFLYIMDDAHRREEGPVDPACDCALCRRYSKAYLYHLFKVGDPQAHRLATAHSLRFYGRLMELLRHA